MLYPDPSMFPISFYIPSRLPTPVVSVFLSLPYPSVTDKLLSDPSSIFFLLSPASLSAASTLASLSALTLTPSGITASVPTSNILHSHRGRLQSSTNGHGQGHTLSTSFEDNTPLTLIGGIASSVPSISFIQDLGDGEVDVEDFDDDAISVNGSSKKVAKGVKVKKRGTIFQCESCSKVNPPSLT